MRRIVAILVCVFMSMVLVIPPISESEFEEQNLWEDIYGVQDNNIYMDGAGMPMAVYNVGGTDYLYFGSETYEIAGGNSINGSWVYRFDGTDVIFEHNTTDYWTIDAHVYNPGTNMLYFADVYSNLLFTGRIRTYNGVTDTWGTIVNYAISILGVPSDANTPKYPREFVQYTNATGNALYVCGAGSGAGGTYENRIWGSYTADTTTWYKAWMNYTGTGALGTISGCREMTVFAGELWMSTYDTFYDVVTPNATVLQWNETTNMWWFASTTTTDFETDYLFSFTHFNGQLIAGCANGAEGCYWLSPDGATWTKYSFPETNIIKFYNDSANSGYFYASADSGGDGSLYRTLDLYNWDKVWDMGVERKPCENSFIYYNSHLYIGTAVGDHPTFEDMTLWRLGTSQQFSIEIKNPSPGIIYNNIDLVAHVDEGIYTVDEVNFKFEDADTEKWLIATYDTDTSLYIHEDFNTRKLENGDYTLYGYANMTTGQYDIDTVNVRIENNYQDCYQDPDTGTWICPKSRTYPGDKTRGSVDGSFLDPWWIAVYWVEASGSGTSVHFEDVRLDTGDTCIDDGIAISDMDYSNRAWINTTTTELANTTYLTFFDGGGCQELYVNSSVTLTAYRQAEIRHVVAFNWSKDPITDEYSITITISNTLSDTMSNIFFYVPVAPDTQIDPKRVVVEDLTNGEELDAGEDYAFDLSGFYMEITSITSSNSQVYTFEYFNFIEGSSVIIPTMTITDNEVEGTIYNGKEMKIAEDKLKNKNQFDYTGQAKIIFDLPRPINKNEMIYIEDDDGTAYTNWYWDGSILVIQEVSIDSRAEKDMNIYFRYVADISEPMRLVQQNSMWFFLILGLVAMLGFFGIQWEDRAKAEGRENVLWMYKLMFLIGALGFVILMLVVWYA